MVKVRVSQYTIVRVYFEHFVYKITDNGVCSYFSYINLNQSQNKLKIKSMC